jgi:hypothetical protein
MLCLSYVSFHVLVRPTKKQRAAARPITAKIPSTIPTIAPGASPFVLAWTGSVAPAIADVAVEAPKVVELDALAPSAGKSSPGCSMNFEFFAPSFCVCRGVLAFWCVQQVTYIDVKENLLD